VLISDCFSDTGFTREWCQLSAPILAILPEACPAFVSRLSGPAGFGVA
jgi:hypothetical protein